MPSLVPLLLLLLLFLLRLLLLVLHAALLGVFFRLYAASGLIQRTDPDARSLSKRRRYIFGFDIEEVEAEICRGRRLRCRYCGNPGACVGCTKRTCPYSFHLPCLYDSKGFVCFKKSFEAFCYKHCPKQDLLPRLLECGDDPPICCICLFSVIPDDDSEKNSASVNKCSKASAVLRNYASSLDQDLVHKHSVKRLRFPLFFYVADAVGLFWLLFFAVF
ncbi:unnamed protein product [Hydatigera taeniaeformis]|uniref:PHD-type domain-containing protein n=1 Tax=Hydatigena taeniaeformis TaxID=6205 RepID=A0A0R3XCM8_HYDTA|nr:unnamed protein product [Hydatigera taeniaeformis]